MASAEKSQVFDLAEDDNSYACAWLFVFVMRRLWEVHVLLFSLGFQDKMAPTSDFISPGIMKGQSDFIFMPFLANPS